jgi:hypothetical protein
LKIPKPQDYQVVSVALPCLVQYHNRQQPLTCAASGLRQCGFQPLRKPAPMFDLNRKPIAQHIRPSPSNRTLPPAVQPYGYCPFYLFPSFICHRFRQAFSKILQTAQGHLAGYHLDSKSEYPPLSDNPET